MQGLPAKLTTEEVSASLLSFMAGNDRPPDEWQTTPIDLQERASRRFRVDAAIDVRAAHFMASVHLLHGREKTAEITGYAFCSAADHQAWRPVSEFWADRSRGDNALQGACSDCQRSRRQRRYVAHKDEELSARARWAEEPGNRDRDHLRRSAHTRINKEQEAARKKRRRERELAVERFVVTDRDLRRLLLRWRSRCAYCGDHVSARTPLEHVTPLSRDGARHSIGNLLPVCVPCNSSKGNCFYMEWRLKRIRRGQPVPPVGLRKGPKGPLP